LTLGLRVLNNVNEDEEAFEKALLDIFDTQGELRKLIKNELNAVLLPEYRKYAGKTVPNLT